jgi:uncharacterized repeat protein (TIGR03803 family)
MNTDFRSGQRVLMTVARCRGILSLSLFLGLGAPLAASGVWTSHGPPGAELTALAAVQAYTVLHGFEIPPSTPFAGLVQGTDGYFYGTTQEGPVRVSGTTGSGTVFQITPSGTLTTLHFFSDSDGASPTAGLVQGTDGNFYGTTQYGGAYGYGTVFQITPSGTLTTRHSFSYSDGAGPTAGLVQGTDGNFYGTTYQGGVYGYGTVFQIAPAGTGLTTLLHSFSSSDGAGPSAGLIQGADRIFYGTTLGGGPLGGGVIFKLALGAPAASAAVSGGGTICAGGSATIQAALTGTPPWSITWSDSVTQSGISTSPAMRSVSPSVTTAYTVTSVSDANGPGTSSGSATVTVNPLPTAVASGSASICPGQSTPLTGSGGVSCSWSPTTGLSNANVCSPNASPSATTTYALTVTDAEGCASTNAPQVTITVNPTPVAAASGGGTINPGGSVTLSGSGGVSCSWSPQNGLDDPFSCSPTASPTATTSYSLTVVNAQGCASTNEASVTVVVTASVQPYTFTHFVGPAGGGSYQDGPGNTARLSRLIGVAVDPAGNVYVTDSGNGVVRKISPAGVVTTLAGSPGNLGTADGVGPSARFIFIQGIAADPFGNVYVADSSANTIRKIACDGTVSTFAGQAGVTGSADGTGSAALFNFPESLATDADGNIYVTDSVNETIRKITPGAVVTTVAGSPGVIGSADGTGSAASFNFGFCEAIAVDSVDTLYVADCGNSTIRRMTSAGVVTTLAGTPGVFGSADGTGPAAQFGFPEGITTDGTNVYVGDSDNFTIRKITPGGVVTTVAGVPGAPGLVDGVGAAARFDGTTQMASDGTSLFVADLQNNAVRKMAFATFAVTTLAGGSPADSGSADGTGTAASFFAPTGITTDGTDLYLTDRGNFTIRKIVTATRLVSTLAGSPGVSGSADGTGAAARFANSQGITSDGANLYVADQSNETIRKVVIATGQVTTLAGTAGVAGSADGTGAAASFNRPTGITTDGSNLYVTDSLFNNTIRKIVIATGQVTTLAGTAGVVGSADGTGSAASFKSPTDVTTDGTNLYVTDTDNHTNIFALPNHSVRQITLSGAVVTTIGGTSGFLGATDGTGPAASFFAPHGIAIVGSNLYVADEANNMIRRGAPAISDVAAIDSATGDRGVPRQLSTTGGQASAWSWSLVTFPEGSTATLSDASISNPIFTPDQPGFYRFRLDATGQAGQSITTVDLSVLCSGFPTAPPVSNNGPIFEGQTLQLTAGSVPGGLYCWTGPNGFASGSGTYSLTVSVSGCTSEVATTAATVTRILMTLSPPAVIGGVSSTGTVTLSSAAPAGGAAVTLASSDTTVATVPASVTVAAGTTTKTFTVTTKAVAAQASVTISGSHNGSTSTAGLTVDPAVLSSFTVSPASVIGGKTSKGTVTLNGKAPSAGAVVTLSSADASATVPATVKVASGATSATFTIPTTPVATTVGPFNISASYNAVTLTAPLTVREATASKLSVSPTSVVGGVSSKGTITLTGAAPAGGAVVALGSANSAATMPANVTVQAGSSSTTFPITTIPVSATQGPFDISATYNAVTVKAQLTVQAAALSKIVVTPSSVTGGTPASGTVTLTGNAPAGDAVVTLASANAAATVPANVTVTAGTSTATFPITTTAVAASTGAFNISATYNGVTKSATLTVKAPTALSLVLNPTTASGGKSSLATVALDGPAPSGGTVVTLKSSNTAVATVPATVTVTATNTTATFTVSTVAVTSSTTSKISATAGGSTRTATLTVTP